VPSANVQPPRRGRNRRLMIGERASACLIDPLLWEQAESPFAGEAQSIIMIAFS